MSPMMNPAMLEAQRKQQIEQIRIMLKHNARAVQSCDQRLVVLGKLSTEVRNLGTHFSRLIRTGVSTGNRLVGDLACLSLDSTSHLAASYIDIVYADNEYRLGGLKDEGDRMREALEQLESPILMPGFIPPGSSNPLRQ